MYISFGGKKELLFSTVVVEQRGILIGENELQTLTNTIYKNTI